MRKLRFSRCLDSLPGRSAGFKALWYETECYGESQALGSVSHLRVHVRSWPAPASTGVCLGFWVLWSKNADEAQYVPSDAWSSGEARWPCNITHRTPPKDAFGPAHQGRELYPTPAPWLCPTAICRHLLDVCPSHQI